MNVEMLKEFYVNKFRFKLGCGIVALTLASGVAAQTTPARSVPIRGGTQPFAIASGRFTEFRTPTPNSFPGDITTGSDGNMWFTEQAVDKFGRITPDGVITEFTGVSAPTSIAAGPDGNLWIASAFTPRIARVTPTVQITIFPTPATPTIIRPGNGNYLLFTEFSANKFASITI